MMVGRLFFADYSGQWVVLHCDYRDQLVVFRCDCSGRRVVLHQLEWSSERCRSIAAGCSSPMGAKTLTEVSGGLFFTDEY